MGELNWKSDNGRWITSMGAALAEVYPYPDDKNNDMTIARVRYMGVTHESLFPPHHGSAAGDWCKRKMEELLAPKSATGQQVQTTASGYSGSIVVDPKTTSTGQVRDRLLAEFQQDAVDRFRTWMPAVVEPNQPAAVQPRLYVKAQPAHPTSPSASRTLVPLCITSVNGTNYRYADVEDLVQDIERARRLGDECGTLKHNLDDANRTIGELMRQLRKVRR
jgi:hypothetical protein